MSIKIRPDPFTMTHYDVIIIGAGASGLMCAIEAGKRDKKVLVFDHSDKVGEKILLSGGGCCNFTNLHLNSSQYLSQNNHFCISALKRFNQYDILSMIQKHGISYHERELGRLFTNRSSQDIVNMLLKECRENNVTIIRECGTLTVKKSDLFLVRSKNRPFSSESLVIATGGMSFQEKEALGFGYNIAREFGINVTNLHPGLVPLTYSAEDLKVFKELAGIFVDSTVTCNMMSFRENILFTHRGLSGPAILQISSYWKGGDIININLAPDLDLFELLKQRKHENPKTVIKTILCELLPKRLIEALCKTPCENKPVCNVTDRELKDIAHLFNNWEIQPNGTEGYRTAEVTAGGVDTKELSSKTLESRKIKGLYFIGEVVDVTGHLGGYNLQWAWSSGYCAGQFV